MTICLDVNEIKRLIPHRFPFLFIDKIIDLKVNEEVVAIKNCSINESFFQGHFPNYPIMPGVIGVEAIAQAAGVLFAYSDMIDKGFDVKNTEYKNEKLFLFGTLDNVKFRKPMLPGAVLYIKSRLLKKRSNIWQFEGEILIDNKDKAVELNFSAFIQ